MSKNPHLEERWAKLNVGKLPSRALNLSGEDEKGANIKIRDAGPLLPRLDKKGKMSTGRRANSVLMWREKNLRVWVIWKWDLEMFSGNQGAFVA